MSSNDETGHRLNHRHRYVLAAVIALVACGALALAAGAGYPNTTDALYPRAGVTFNESTVLRGFARRTVRSSVTTSRPSTATSGR